MKVSLTTDPDLLAEAGDPDVLHLFGVQVGFEPVDVDHLTPEQQSTLAGNRFVICDGDPADHDGNGKAGGSVSPEVAELRAHLEALDVKYDKRWKADTLRKAVEAALAGE